MGDPGLNDHCRRTSETGEAIQPVKVFLSCACWFGIAPARRRSEWIHCVESQECMTQIFSIARVMFSGLLNWTASIPLPSTPETSVFGVPTADDQLTFATSALVAAWRSFSKPTVLVRFDG